MTKTKSIFWTAASVSILSLVITLPGVAQDADQSAPPPAASSNGGWRKFQPPDQQAVNQPGDPPPAPPVGDPQNQPVQPPPQAPPPQPRYAPSTITLPAGTWITVRVNEPLSSDHNQTGDAFTGTLLQPIVANGLLIARRGDIVTGIVTEAQESRQGLRRFAFGNRDHRNSAGRWPSGSSENQVDGSARQHFLRA